MPRAASGHERRSVNGGGPSLSLVENKRANRQYTPIPDDEVWRFVDAAEKLYVAFTLENGYPHVTPVWFCVLDKKLYLRTQDYKVKTRLARTGKVCCTLDTGSRYPELKGVVVWGRSRVVTEMELVDTIEKTMRKKYKMQQWNSLEMPAWWVQERKAEKRAYIEINPTKLSSWDNSRIH